MRADRIVMALAALALAACAESQGPTEMVDGPAASVAPAPGNASVFVVHGINGTDVGLSEALPVDVSVGGACALPNFTFRTIEGAIELPAGSYDIAVSLADGACTGPVVIDAPGVALGDGDVVSIVAHLTADGIPTASVFPTDISAVPGRARVIARHTADFGEVDVVVDGGVAFAGVPNGVQGAADLRPGRHTVAITPAGGGAAAFSTPLVLRPFTAYVAYAVGTPENGTFEVLLQSIGLR